MLCQHLDELDTDDDVQRTLQKGMYLHAVGVGQKAGHQLDKRHNAQQQRHQHYAGQHDLQNARCFGDLVAENALEPFLLAVQGIAGQTSSGFTHNFLLFMGIFIIIAYFTRVRQHNFTARFKV